MYSAAYVISPHTFTRQHYNRSTILFHNMIIQDKAGKLQKQDSPLHAEMARPCANAGGFVTEYLRDKVWNDVGGQYITRGMYSEQRVLYSVQTFYSSRGLS